MVQTVDHPKAGRIRVMGIPIKLSDSPGEIQLPPPLLGEHTDEILAELGYSPKEIEAMRRGGIA